MKQYQILLFDVDDTLLDFKACERAALKHTLNWYQIEYNDEMLDYYATLNENLWYQYETGAITRDQIFADRFNKLFQLYHINMDGNRFEKSYHHQLGYEHALMSDALAVIKRLENNYQLVIVSNGVANTQYQRLRDSGLDKYFHYCFISDEIGYRKPLKAFYDYVFNHLPNFEVDKALMIGDSLASDMLGAHLVGMDKVWMNPRHNKNIYDFKIEYEISELRQLLNILEVEDEKGIKC